MKRMVTLGTVVWFALSTVNLSADTWQTFQNGGQPHRPQSAPPVKWSQDEGILWQTDLTGYGQSSPVVHGDTIYVTSTSGAMKDQLFVTAFDRQTGKTIWQHEAKNSTPEKSSNYISRAAPSPACDAAGVVAFFEGGNVIALTNDGKVRWTRDLSQEFGAIKARHGLGSSLEQTQSLVFVWIEREAEPYLLAINKQDGKTVWKSAGLGATSWSSPRIIPVDENTDHLVISGIGKIKGIDPNNGRQLWEFDDLAGNSAPTPMPAGNGRFLIGATVGRGGATTGKTAESNGLLEISRNDKGDFSVEFIWNAKRATSTFGSPVVYQDCVYFVARQGVVYCLDAKTGEEHYVQRTAESTWATTIAAGDRVYLFGKSGTTTVLAAGPEFRKLGENPLWKSTQPAAPGGFGGPVLYAAVLVDNQFLIRRGDKLFCIATQE